MIALRLYSPATTLSACLQTVAIYEPTADVKPFTNPSLVGNCAGVRQLRCAWWVIVRAADGVGAVQHAPRQEMPIF